MRIIFRNLKSLIILLQKLLNKLLLSLLLCHPIVVFLQQMLKVF